MKMIEMYLDNMMHDYDFIGKFFADEDVAVITTENKAKNRRERRIDAKAKRKNRIKDTDIKKRRLGSKWRYANEEITGYYVDDEEVTHWVGEPEEIGQMTIEEAQRYLAKIPWDKVKGINPKKCGYKAEAKGDTLWSRKDRHQKFSEVVDEVFAEDVIDPMTGEVLAMAGELVRPIEFYDEAIENWIDEFHVHPDRFEWHMEEGHYFIDSYIGIDDRSNKMVGASGFIKAAKAVRLNHEINILKDAKQALLEEYADKIEKLNVMIRRRMAEM